MSVPLVVCLGQFTIDDVVRWDGLVRMGAIGGRREGPEFSVGLSRGESTDGH